MQQQHHKLRALHVLLLSCCFCCWSITSVSGTLSSGGQEPWLVVWKKGVDGDLLWKTLCPTISTGDFTTAEFQASDFMPLPSEQENQPPASRGLLGRSSTTELLLNCSTRFKQLFNGFAGHFTLKELETIKSRYKHVLDYVLSDKAIQVDSPADMLLAEQWAAQHGDEAAAPTTSPTNRHLASQHEPSGPSMSMTFPASGSAPQRHLLFTPPPRPQLPPAPHTAARLDKRRKLPEQANATWGLDVLDQGRVPLDSVYHYTYNGTGVHVYILDTGIRTTHEEFWDEAAQRSRAVHGFDAVYGTNSSEDCHGHGSHVAAVVGGNTFGVAKNVTLHAVRVLACDGTAMVSALLKGLEWVAKNHIKPAVVHMSIEGSFSSIVNQAVEQLIKIDHVHVVVSSGNSGKDACLASPASSPSAITVAAIDDKLSRWSYANWGACVDVFAPGVAILSAVSNKGDNGTAFKTGTSMAAPFVTGVVAAYLETHPGASAEEVQQKLYQSAMRGSVTDDPQGFATMFPSAFPDLVDISSTPNRLLQANLSGQANLHPGTLSISANTTEALQIEVALSQRPLDNVTVSVSVPPAWDATPMAEVAPLQLVFTADTWDTPQSLLLQPRLVCDGDYYVKLAFQGNIEDGFPAMHTVLVSDSRNRSGENALMARVITQLPFNDTGDTSAFADNYGCQATDAAPDVVYSYTPALATDVTISTCGSGFDTKLLVSTNLSDPTTYMCNDDDRTCVSNTACSRLDVSLEAGTRYFIVVDGYSGASGEYSLSVSCNPVCPSDTDSSFILDTRRAPPTSPSPGFSSSNLLIQQLLHLSRNPPPPSTSSPSPSPLVPQPPPVADPPVAAAPSSPNPSLPPPARQPTALHAGTPPLGDAVQRATPLSPSGDSLGPNDAQPAQQPPVEGPIAALLAANSGVPAGAAAPTVGADPLPSAGPPPQPDHMVNQGPLQQIQASSREGAAESGARAAAGNTNDRQLLSAAPGTAPAGRTIAQTRTDAAAEPVPPCASNAQQQQRPVLVSNLGGLISLGHAQPAGGAGGALPGAVTGAGTSSTGLGHARGFDGAGDASAASVGRSGAAASHPGAGGSSNNNDSIIEGPSSLGRRLDEQQQQQLEVSSTGAPNEHRNDNGGSEAYRGWDEAAAQLASLTKDSQEQAAGFDAEQL